jgi:hypothetical protein
MGKCWEQRGCDEEMRSTCAHHTEFKDRCPTKCAFANCERPAHVLASDPEIIFSTEVDREVVIKDICMFCEFFIENGPRLS